MNAIHLLRPIRPTRLTGLTGLTRRQFLVYSSGLCLRSASILGRRISPGLSAFTPRSLPGCALWLDASHLDVPENSSLALWPDLSGKDHQARQPVPAKQPLFQTHRQNGRPAVYFDGVDDYMAIDADPGLGLAAFSVVAVIKPFSAGIVVLKGASPDWAWANYVQLDGQLKSSVIVDSVQRDLYSLISLLNGCYLVIASYATLQTLVINDHQPQSQSVPGALRTGDNALTLGAWVGGIANQLSGCLFELIYYDHALTNSSLLLLQQYIRAKYANW